MKISITFLILLLAYVHILHAQALSSTVVRDGYQMWEPSLNSATQFAMEHLNRDKPTHLEKINVENVKVAQGIMYTLGLELDLGPVKNARYEISFLQPSQGWHPLWGTLPSPEPSSTPLSTALSLASSHIHYQPQLPELSMTLHGPLEVYLYDRATELHIRTPREVDVGYVDKIVLANGANMTVSGFTELHLKEPLTVHALPAMSNDKLIVEVKNTPKVAFVGRRVDITNATEAETLKVKKRGLTEIEILSATETPVRTHPAPFEISLNDSRLQTIQLAMRQLGESAEALGQAPVLRRLFSTKLEAVTTFFIPMEVSSETGERTDWEITVAQSANTKTPSRIVSSNRKGMVVELAYDWELAANGTLGATVQNFISNRHDYKLHQL